MANRRLVTTTRVPTATSRGTNRQSEQTIFRVACRIFRDILLDGISSSEFVDVDPRLAGFFILAGCNWLYTWFKPDGPHDPEEIATVFISMMLHGLLP